MSLDADPGTFRRWLHRAADEVVRLNGSLDALPAARRSTPAALRQRFDRPLPRQPEDLEAVLPQLCEELLAATSLNVSPRFFGYVISSGNQIGTVAELLQGGLNLCPSKWDVSASATEVERCAVRWIAEFIGLPATMGGALVSGGTMANLTGLIAARTARAGAEISRKGLYALPRLLAYVSSEGHACHERNMDVLGLGREQLVKIPVRSDFTIDCDALEQRLRADTAAGHLPFCVIGNGGTTNTGAVDDLVRLAEVCARHGVWFHVDGAYGAPAARTPSAGHLFRGLERADSVALDPHKWLFAPLEAGCVLVRDPLWLRRSFQVDSDYLRPSQGQAGPFDVATDVVPEGDSRVFEWIDYTLQTTRDFRGLKVWLAFRGYGADRILAAIEHNILTMRYLAERIDEAEDFELLAPAPLSTVCFRYRTSDARVHGDEAQLDEWNTRLRQALEADGRVCLPGTKIGGREALRACTVNHRTTRRDVETLLAVVRELGAPLARAASTARG